MAFRATERMRHKTFVAWKWALSFATKERGVNNYPVVVRRHETTGDSDLSFLRFQQPYSAFILGASLSGSGESADEALVGLRTRFERWKVARLAEGKVLPRPGTSFPVELADSSKIEAHGALTADFIHRALQLDWALITDESSLWDFHTERDNTRLQARVKDLYGVDVSDIASGNLHEILDRIAAHRLAHDVVLI